MARAGRWLLGLALVVAFAMGAAFALLPGFIEDSANQVVPHAPYPIRPDAQRLHERLVVADWHADSLLWGRDLLERGDVGHVDLPRLAEGNVAIQVFDAVTKSPQGQNYDENSAEAFDMVTALAIANLWPVRTWTSLAERALLQAEALHAFAARAPERLVVVTTREDLEEVLSRRAAGERELVGGLLGIEGLHALDGELANIERLFDAGYRVMGLQHFFDNELGGSLHGQSGSGLSAFGREAVAKLAELGIVIDVAHSSPAVVDEVLALSKRPIVVSHTGVYGACQSARNLRDDQMRRIAEHGGVIAVGYWDGAICDVTPQGVVAAIRKAVDLFGEDHVSLGSDYDGGTTVLLDTSELAVLTQEMLDTGFTQQEIEKVMGGNAIRMLRAQLPRRRSP